MRVNGAHLAICLPLLLLGVGCGGGGGGDASDEADAEPSSSTSSSAPEPTGPAFGEEIPIGVAATMTVQEPALGDGQRLDVLVSVEDSFQLEGGTEAGIDLFLACAGNYKTGRTFTDASTPEPILSSDTVPSGGKVEGYVSLELPMYDGSIVEACLPGQIQLVVPGFAGQDVVYQLDDELAESLLDAV